MKYLIIALAAAIRQRRFELGRDVAEEFSQHYADVSKLHEEVDKLDKLNKEQYEKEKEKKYSSDWKWPRFHEDGGFKNYKRLGKFPLDPDDTDRGSGQYQDAVKIEEGVP